MPRLAKSPNHSVYCVALAVALLAARGQVSAHEAGHSHDDDVKAPVPLTFVTENRGPIAAPKAGPQGARTTGHGFWRFIHDPSKMPVPAAAAAKIRSAHGTVAVDPATGTAYLGLPEVGLVAFTDNLTQSAVVAQDPAFAAGNLHGIEFLPRKGKSSLIVAADNAQAEVYLGDTSFQSPKILKYPDHPAYADRKGYAPTDATFGPGQQVWITDGYGKSWVMPATMEPFRFTGPAYGGKKLSAIPHGITYNPKTGRYIISGRSEGHINDWNPKSKQLVAIDALPTDSTVCDVDLWGDYALAPCLDGRGKSPGPIYIVNLRKKVVVASLNLKTDLGIADAQHIHDACWYITGKGRNREVYILYTNWNPGGVGALKLVGPGS